jgi:hypothetical protein
VSPMETWCEYAGTFILPPEEASGLNIGK